MCLLDVLASAVFLVLLVNVVTALVVVSVRGRPGTWLLVLLLTGTTGAALVSLLALTMRGEATVDHSRFVDIALVLTALAAVSTAVGNAAQRRSRPPLEGRSSRFEGTTPRRDARDESS